MMGRFRKKPVVIEAFQWLGSPDQTDDPVWICDAIREGWVRFEGSGTPECAMLITTLEGVMRASLGDWIIRGVSGEIYPCKPEIFEATYASADEASASDVWLVSTLLPDEGQDAWEVNGVFSSLEAALAACGDGNSAAVRMRLDVDYHGIREFWMATPDRPEPRLVSEQASAA